MDRLDENAIGAAVVDSSLMVHRELGPGLLESVYEVVLARELSDRGLCVQRQVPVPIQYRGVRFDEGFRADLIVSGVVIVELKSVAKILDVHRKQVLTYLRLAGMRLGYLMNFGEALMKTGMVRIVNDATEDFRLRRAVPTRIVGASTEGS